MKFRVIFFKILTVSILLVFVACSQKSGGDAEFTIDGTSEMGNSGSKVSLNEGVSENMSEQARIQNYAKVAQLDPEITWTKWQDYKTNLDSSIELNLVGFTYNAANLDALAKFFIATDKNVGFTFKALFQKPVNLFIIAQYTYYTFKAAAQGVVGQQQANTLYREGEEKAAGIENDSNRRGIRGAATRFQGAIETFSNALAIFNRLLIADYQAVGLDVTGLDIKASGSREFAKFNVGQLDATAIENKLAGTDYTFSTFLNQQLEFIFSSSVLVANGIEYTFVSYQQSEYTFSTELNAQIDFASQESLEFVRGIKADAGNQRATLQQQKTAVGIEAQAQIDQENQARYQAIEKETEQIEIENQIKINGVTNQEAQILLDSSRNTLSISNQEQDPVGINKNAGNQANQGTNFNQGTRESVYQKDSDKVMEVYSNEREILFREKDPEEKSDDDLR